MSLPDWISDRACVLAGGAALERSSAALGGRVDAVLAALEACPRDGAIGLLSDNSLEWVAADLAAHLGGRALVPLPGFFTRAQLAHVAGAAGMQALLCPDGETAAALGFEREVVRLDGLCLFEKAAAAPAAGHVQAAEPLQKITFTSGSTGTPRGVCLTAEQQLRTARSLAELIAPLGIRRHLALLPLSLLLENVAGVYVPLMIGAACIVAPLQETGLAGASGFDPDRCLDAIARYGAESVILLPQMLRALVARLDEQRVADPRVRSLRFIAVGGARTPPALISHARRLGLPVYEGYGLSECASVVTLNVPGADRAGSVGRAVPGTAVRAAADGEIEIAGRGFAGYLGAPRAPADWLKTGDIGAVDADGYVYVHGRKSSVLITGYGRNVSPEWPESLLLESPAVAQAVVFGEGRPCLVALLVPARAGVSDADLTRAVQRANSELPDYASIGAWLRAPEPLTCGNGLATANGRVRRDAVWARYAAALDRLYPTAGKIPA